MHTLHAMHGALCLCNLCCSGVLHVMSLFVCRKCVAAQQRWLKCGPAGACWRCLLCSEALVAGTTTSGLSMVHM
jgi:hypothetical protein